jgi:hypothetical protein
VIHCPERAVSTSRKTGWVNTHGLYYRTYISPHLHSVLCMPERAHICFAHVAGMSARSYRPTVLSSTNCEAHTGATDVTICSLSFSSIRCLPLFPLRACRHVRSISCPYANDLPTWDHALHDSRRTPRMCGVCGGRIRIFQKPRQLMSDREGHDAL